MVVDLDIKAEELGISFDDYASADRKLGAMTFLPEYDGTVECNIRNISSLPEREMVAFIRWNDLHKRFPEYFCWDGLVKRDADEA